MFSHLLPPQLEKNIQPIDPCIEAVLMKYASVFKEPKGSLPPSREDHPINMEEGTFPYP